jgi:hypothetical protein
VSAETPRWDDHETKESYGTYSMEHSPSSEASSHSASQEILRIFMKTEGSLLCSQEPATGSYPEPYESSPQIPTLFT